MKHQNPAKGIYLVNNWGSSVIYKSVCECGNDSCSHTIDVEADDTNVSITVYSKVKTNWWSKSRFAVIWDLLSKGYSEYESQIVLSQQSALNYAETIKQAISDVEKFRNDRSKL